uniref:MHC class I-like antigen recognition-like domain-containing protein n=1 Tax=Astyanax mexicanus TaxID=7994 RepID=A0A3B1KJV1_ASTMX
MCAEAMKKSNLLFLLLFYLLQVTMVLTDSNEGPERDSSADSGSLNLCISVVKTSGFNTIPEYIQKNTLNDVTIFHYDSDMDSKMPCPDWINSTAARREWNYMQFQTDRISYHITQGFESAVQQFNRTGSLADRNIYQARGCCVLYPNGTSASSLTHTFNGKDFIGSILTERHLWLQFMKQLCINTKGKPEAVCSMYYTSSELSAYKTFNCLKRLLQSWKEKVRKVE